MPNQTAPPAGRTIRLSTRFSPCRRYRYCLHRMAAEDGSGAVAFIMLNPSTADERKDDPTIRRCLGFARAWGYRHLYVVNLSPLRTSSPKLLRTAGDDPAAVQALNAQYVRQAVRAADLTVAAWGVHGVLCRRDRRIMRLVAREGKSVHCLGTTQAGHPRHPLYLSRQTLPRRYAGQCGVG